MINEFPKVQRYNPLPKQSARFEPPPPPESGSSNLEPFPITYKTAGGLMIVVDNCVMVSAKPAVILSIAKNGIFIKDGDTEIQFEWSQFMEKLTQ